MNNHYFMACSLGGCNNVGARMDASHVPWIGGRYPHVVCILRSLAAYRALKGNFHVEFINPRHYWEDATISNGIEFYRYLTMLHTLEAERVAFFGAPEDDSDTVDDDWLDYGNGNDVIVPRVHWNDEDDSVVEPVELFFPGSQ